MQFTTLRNYLHSTLHFLSAFPDHWNDLRQPSALFQLFGCVLRAWNRVYHAHLAMDILWPIPGCCIPGAHRHAYQNFKEGAWPFEDIQRHSGNRAHCVHWPFHRMEYSRTCAVPECGCEGPGSLFGFFRCQHEGIVHNLNSCFLPPPFQQEEKLIWYISLKIW